MELWSVILATNCIHLLLLLRLMIYEMLNLTPDVQGMVSVMVKNLLHLQDVCVTDINNSQQLLSWCREIIKENKTLCLTGILIFMFNSHPKDILSNFYFDNEVQNGIFLL